MASVSAMPLRHGVRRMRCMEGRCASRGASCREFGRTPSRPLPREKQEEDTAEDGAESSEGSHGSLDGHVRAHQSAYHCTRSSSPANSQSSLTAPGNP
jgi:hypothetical protein